MLAARLHHAALVRPCRERARAVELPLRFGCVVWPQWVLRGRAELEHGRLKPEVGSDVLGHVLWGYEDVSDEKRRSYRQEEKKFAIRREESSDGKGRGGRAKGRQRKHEYTDLPDGGVVLWSEVKVVVGFVAN